MHENNTTPESFFNILLNGAFQNIVVLKQHEGTFAIFSLVGPPTGMEVKSLFLTLSNLLRHHMNSVFCVFINICYHF